MLKNIYVPSYIKGVKSTLKSYPKRVKIFGADVESIDGKPYTLQICNEDKVDLFMVNEKTITEVFIRYLRENFKSTFNHVVFFHNLSFDLPMVFYPYLSGFERNEFCIIDKDLKFSAEIFCGKMFFANLALFKGKTKASNIRLIDSGCFLKGSLQKLANDLKLVHQKLDPPKGLGEKVLTDPYFMNYAKNDALVEYDLGNYIAMIHKEYNVPISVSIAQLSQYIFTRNFMGDSIIKLPRRKILESAELSYHGGKNGFYLDKPQRIKDVYEIDVVSMYPYAMSNIPPMTSGEFKSVYEFDEQHEGIYSVTGKVSKCKYPIIADHEFNYCNNELISNIWTTSYELREAIQKGEIEIDKIFGYVWVPDSDSVNPLKDYVMHFYEKKRITPKTDSRYVMYKYLMNSLYGKFIQNVRHDVIETAVDDGKKLIHIPAEYEAGGLYNPFIASLITGFGRAYLHRLEHQFNALDSSTDSVKTIMNPSRYVRSELGGLSIKNFGDCIFLRNKLYIHYTNPKINSESSMKNMEMTYALHGFHGKIGDLITVLKTKNPNYRIKRMTKVKESILHKDIKPLTMQEFVKTLNIDMRGLNFHL